MPEINLLPKEFVPKKATLRLANQIKLLDLIGTIIFFICVLGMVIVFILNANEIKASKVRQDKLMSSIKSMQNIEQQYVFVKDRVSRIQKLRSSENNAMQDLENYYKLVTGVPSGVSFLQAEVDAKKTKTNLLVDSSDTLAKSLATIIAADSYEKVILKSFYFEPGKGYFLSLELTSVK